MVTYNNFRAVLGNIALAKCQVKWGELAKIHLITLSMKLEWIKNNFNGEVSEYATELLNEVETTTKETYNNFVVSFPEKFDKLLALMLEHKFLTRVPKCIRRRLIETCR